MLVILTSFLAARANHGTSKNEIRHNLTEQGLNNFISFLAARKRAHRLTTDLRLSTTDQKLHTAAPAPPHGHARGRRRRGIPRVWWGIPRGWPDDAGIAQ